MRTELKVVVTVFLVVSVMVLVYFVFIAGGHHNPTQQDLGSLTRAPDPNHPPLRTDRATASPRPAIVRASPTPAVIVAVTATPSPAPIIMIPPSFATPAPSPSGSDSVVIVNPIRTTPAPTAAPLHSDGPPDTLVAPVILSPIAPSPAPRAVEANRAPSRFEPTPIYIAPSPRVDPIATPVEPHPTLAPILPGTGAEANVPPAAAAGLIRGTDGNDYYVVQKGDKGYWGIAAKPYVYGDGRKWDLIEKANPKADPSDLHEGQKLVIPRLSSPPSATPPPISVTTHPAGNMYKVKAGDTLESIAKSQYNDGSLWKIIAKANPGADPSKLQIGQELVIPPAPSRSPAPSPSPSPDVPPVVIPGMSTPSPSPTARPSPTPRPSPTARPTPTDRPAPTPGGFD